MTGRRLLLIALLVVAVTATVGGFFGYRHYRITHPGVVDVQTAWVAVRADPRDPERWAILADAQAAIDQAQAAEQSYLTAVRLGSDDATVYGRLGFLLYGHGRDSEALSALRQAHDLGAELPMLGRTLGELEARLAPPAPPPAPPSEDPETYEAEVAHQNLAPQVPLHGCTVPAPRLGTLGPFIVTTVLNGSEVPLVVDTGASLTTLSLDLVQELDLVIDDQRTIHAITATGPATFPTAYLDSVEIGGRRLEQLTVAVCNACGGRAAGGLLGLDVQAALGMELDIGNAEVRFVECERD